MPEMCLRSTVSMSREVKIPGGSPLLIRLHLAFRYGHQAVKRIEINQIWPQGKTMMMKELECTSWKQWPKDLPSPCALASWRAQNCLKAVPGAGSLSSRAGPGELKTPCQPALAQAALGGAVQAPSKHSGAGMPFPVPQGNTWKVTLGTRSPAWINWA